MGALAYLVTGMVTGCVAAIAGIESSNNFRKGYNEISGKDKTGDRNTLTEVLLQQFHQQ